MGGAGREQGLRRAPTQVRVSGLLMAEAGAGSWLWGWLGGSTQFPRTPTEKIPPPPHPWRQFLGEGTEGCQGGKQPRKLRGGEEVDCWGVSEVGGKKYYKMGSDGGGGLEE